MNPRKISVYSSRHGKTPPVVITGPLEHMLSMLDKTRDALSSTKQGNSKTIKLSSEWRAWGDNYHGSVQLSPDDWIENLPMFYRTEAECRSYQATTARVTWIVISEKWKSHLGSVIKEIGDDAEHAIKARYRTR